MSTCCWMQRSVTGILAPGNLVLALPLALTLTLSLDLALALSLDLALALGNFQIGPAGPKLPGPFFW